MGTKASKHVVEPPDDWEPQGATRSFEIISPCSDLSNPSDFNRVRYNRESQNYQSQRSINNHESNSRPSNPSRPSSRNASKNQKSSDYDPHNLPVAVKVRKSNSTSGNSDDDIIAPGAFYFPTKESERRADRLARKEFKGNHHGIANNRSGKQVQVSKSMKGKAKSFRSLARKTAKKMKKRKDAVKRIAVALGHACLEETRNKMVLNQDTGINATRQRRSTEELEISRRNKDRKNSGSLRSRRRSEQIALGDLQANIPRRDVPLSKLKKDVDQKKSIRDKSSNYVENDQNQMDLVTSAALHQADAYFERLTLSPSKNHGASPFVHHRSDDVRGNRVTSIMESTAKKTPRDRTRRPLLDSPIDTPVSDLFSANNMRDNEYLISSIKSNNISPVSSLMRFYTNTGPIESSPKSYCSDADDTLVKEFSGELKENGNQMRGIAQRSQHESIGGQSRGSSSSLYTAESKSYKKIDGKELKILSHDDHENEPDDLPSYYRVRDEQLKEESRMSSKQKSKERKPKVSKLESLFRPILPAFSTDDAQSVYSYDPYEIKVTESAPGAIQASKYTSLGSRSSFPRNANDESPSKSILSIDSQRRRSSTAIAKHMVSNQAQHNGDFLFADDYGPIVMAQNPDKLRDNSALSISTAGSRSRLAQKSTQKGVIIQMKSFDKEKDDVSFDSRSTRSERRVRFSLDSARLLPKNGTEVSEIEENRFSGNTADVARRPMAKREERDDSSVCEIFEDGDEGSETDVVELQARFATKPSGMKFHKFAPKVTRVHSVDESIDLPEIESKVSDLSETNSESSRNNSESALGDRSQHTVPDSIPEEDENTVVSRSSSIHWTKTENGVTPYVPGKSSINPTKSPYFRYQDAKTIFNTQKHRKTRASHMKTKSPRKIPSKSPAKSPAKTLRKGSGGLVSVRIQALNTRVSEVRKLKRMRKKMTNPRLHTHNFDNTQPVRSRALINYKTKFGSANIVKSNNVNAAKFNMIPDLDDDDDNDNDSVDYLPVTHQNYDVGTGRGDTEEDDVSRMSEATGATVATVRQQRCSMTSRTTASSGFTNLKKQVFRTSDGARSIASNSDSTLMSVMTHKENESSFSFRTTAVVKSGEQNFAVPPPTLLAPPCKGTPAMKWRTLAAAAAEKDALKASSSKPRKMLGTRSINCDNNYHIYGFKD